MPRAPDALDLVAAGVVGKNLRILARGNSRRVAQRTVSLAAGGVHLDRGGRAPTKSAPGVRIGGDGDRDHRNCGEYIFGVDDRGRQGRETRGGEAVGTS